MTQQPQNKIGAGKGVLSRNEHHYRRGTLIFIEGEISREMYIIRSGKVRVIKQEGEATRELAVLSTGSVLGELSLLDSQPRSATAQVVEDAVVTIIDEELFNVTMRKVPHWLASVIQLIVKRLRDTMKKVSDDIIRESISGVIRVLLLLNETDSVHFEGLRAVSLSKLKEKISSIIGIGGIETEEVLSHLIFKEMVLIRKDGSNREHVLLKDPEVLSLYMNFYRAKQGGAKLIGESFTEDAYQLLKTIIAVADRDAPATGNPLVKIGKSKIELEIERQGGRHINPDALNELLESQLIRLEEQKTETAHGSHKKEALLVKPQLLKKVYLLRAWLPVFKENICN